MDASEILYGTHRRKRRDQSRLQGEYASADFDLFTWARSHHSELTQWCWKHPLPLLKLLAESEYSLSSARDQLRFLTPSQGDAKLMLNYRQQPDQPRTTVFIDPLEYLEDFEPAELEQLQAYAEECSSH